MLSLSIGDASDGLCGGMVFAARDYFEWSSPPPDLMTPPGEGELFDYLVDRLFESFDLPRGPARYLELMSPFLADAETVWSRLGLAPHGRAWRMINAEWPKVRDEIDQGHPSALGLVRVKTSDPLELKRNHQVLAYGYGLEGSRLTLRLYDPNRPGRDDVTLSLSLADPSNETPVTAEPSGGPVFSFFRVSYRPASPPSVETGSSLGPA